ncbi:hypothetical protein Taro_055336 [Colocasia esculenta]|uniref:Uncharacterized protein n=1 Tax=Colocasia esculenta TaxID=4460 RepID=A0A843XSM3_COLES|nr:hypothetical protein [Colocasia esculenta]
MGITTFSEVSYPDLVKAFYVCLRTEADGSLISSVKGTQIKIDHEVLKTLFDVSTSGHSGIHLVDSQGEQERIVEEAPVQGEQDIEKEASSQGEHTEDAPVNEGHIEAQIEIKEQMERSSKNKKNAHKRQKKILKKMHLKPILKRLDDQGAVLDSVQSAVSSVFVYQESMSNDISHIINALKWFNKELSSMKVMVSEVLKAVGPKDPTPQERHSVDAQAGPSGPSVVAPAGPSGPSIVVQPSEILPIEDSDLCQWSGPEKETLNPVEPVAERADQAVAPEPLASSTLPTLVAPSPPSSSTAPPAPTTFKRPRPRSVSSPQPFPSQLASSPVSSTILSSASTSILFSWAIFFWSFLLRTLCSPYHNSCFYLQSTYTSFFYYHHS